jgi:hypothetical protein
MITDRDENSTCLGRLRVGRAWVDVKEVGPKYFDDVQLDDLRTCCEQGTEAMIELRRALEPESVMTALTDATPY